VIGMQHHDPVHGLGQNRVHHIVLCRNREAHVQEVPRVIQCVLWINEGLADRILVGHRRNRRQLGDHPDRRDLALPGIVDVGRVVVVHLFMHHGVVGHPAAEIGQLRRRRQFAVEQKIANLEIA
jgi:hypothetical protein